MHLAASDHHLPQWRKASNYFFPFFLLRMYVYRERYVRFSFSSFAAVAALVELCCCSVAAPASNVKSISLRFFFNSPAVPSLPPSLPTSRHVPPPPPSLSLSLSLSLFLSSLVLSLSTTFFFLGLGQVSLPPSPFFLSGGCWQACLYVDVYVCIDVCMYVCTYKRMHVCMYLCTYVNHKH
jgi:hypothetical protein